jgi:hypothetical protein
MMIPEVEETFQNEKFESAIIVGIEVSYVSTIKRFSCSAEFQSHVCVMQTTLDLLRRGITPYILADGVSSCNKQEIPIALERLRQAGAIITSSESLLFQLVGKSLSLDDSNKT